MRILTDNPVLQREMRGRTRVRSLQTSKSARWAAGAIALVIGYFYVRAMINIGRGTPMDARDAWSLLVMGLLLLVVILAPALTSTAITQEREQQTWETLTTTNLTAGEVLMGKWLARQIPLGFLALIALPFLIGCGVKAELGLFATLSVLLFLILTTGVYSILGLLCSFLARKTAMATASSLVASLTLCLGTVIFNALWQAFSFMRGSSYSGGYVYQDTPIIWLNPFYAIMSLATLTSAQPLSMGTSANAPNAAVVTTYCVVSLLVVLLSLSFMITRYRSAVRER